MGTWAEDQQHETYRAYEASGEWLDWHGRHWYEVGRIAMIADQARVFREVAGKAFAGGYDEKAKVFREVAVGMERLEQQLRKTLAEDPPEPAKPEGVR